MHPIRWVPSDALALLDVGCNVGAFLRHCHEAYPAIRLAGVEVNSETLEAARRNVPEADLHVAGAADLPFADETFDYVTCIEVLEHIPAELRAQSLSEMHRVLKPGGRLALRVPNAGVFAFLDSNNLRFRLPWLYRRLIGGGMRDHGYVGGSADIVWHHHFSRHELLELAGTGWKIEAYRCGGLFLFPLIDLARWPFYRAGCGDHPVSLFMEQLADFDLGFDYGAASIDIMMILERI
jgi:SAM-dependent methyltransferase